MKLFIISAMLFTCSVQRSFAQQQFLDKATIEYEVRSNIKKTIGNGMWAEMMKDNLPTFKTAYYTLSFSDNKSLYKFDHWDEKAKLPDYMRRDDESSSYYTDLNSGKFTALKTVAGTPFTVSDSLPAMEWRMTNESRVIAGFNCRKAVTKIFDSVYVFAFYSDEILLPGGPCSFHGLPGTILGITIPRLFTSWIATRVSVNGVPVNDIKPATAKKYYTRAAMKKIIDDTTKDWWTGEEATDEQKQQKNRFIWGVML